MYLYAKKHVHTLNIARKGFPRENMRISLSLSKCIRTIYMYSVFAYVYADKIAYEFEYISQLPFTFFSWQQCNIILHSI